MEKHIRRDTLLNGLMRAIGGVIWLIFNALIVKAFPIDVADTIFLTMNSLLLISLVSRLGADQQALKLCSLAALHETNSLPWVTLKIMMMSTAALFVLIAFLQVAKSIFELSITPVIETTARASTQNTLPAIGVTLTTIIGFCLQGQGRAWVGTFLISVLFPMCLILAATIALSSNLSVSFIFLLAAFSTSGLAVLVYLTMRPRALKNGRAAPTNFKFNLNFYIISLCSFCVTWLPLFYLRVESDGLASAFTVIQRYSMLMSFGLLAVNSVIAPKIAASMERNNVAATNALLKKAAGLTVAIGVTLGVVLVIASNHILSFHNFSGYVGTPALMILITGQLISLLCGPCGIVLMMSSDEGYYAKTQLYGLSCTAILCCLLIPRTGLMGACTATSTGLILQNLLATRRCYLHRGLRPTIFG